MRGVQVAPACYTGMVGNTLPARGMNMEPQDGYRRRVQQYIKADQPAYHEEVVELRTESDQHQDRCEFPH
jgi:hypothetical protein